MHLLSPDHQVLRFSGPDAQAFLQSQLTNDVDALRPGAWQWQGYCSAKGRLLATFALAQVAALGIVAAFTGVGHLPTILQYHTPTVNVAAWRAPMSGAAGATIVGLELLSIVAGIALCTRRGRIRHVGHAILTAWITFWLYRLLSLAVAVGEVELWGLVALCSVAAGCQLVAWKLSPKPVAG